MKYNIALDILESKGINYHRMVAKFILDNLLKIYPANSASILVQGDRDLLISYLLAEKYRIHVMDIGYEEPNNTHKIVIVDENSFPLEEYDVIIALFTTIDFIEKCINARTSFFIIPEYRLDFDANNYVCNLLETKNIEFKEISFNSFMHNRTAIYNFKLKKYD